MLSIAWILFFKSTRRRPARTVNCTGSRLFDFASLGLRCTGAAARCPCPPAAVFRDTWATVILALRLNKCTNDAREPNVQ